MNQQLEEHLERAEHSLSEIQVRDYLTQTGLFPNPEGLSCYADALRAINRQAKRIEDLERQLAIQTRMIEQQAVQKDNMRKEIDALRTTVKDFQMLGVSS